MEQPGDLTTQTDAFAEAASIYDAASLGGPVATGTRPAVLVVDFSCGFTDPEAPLGSDLNRPVLATKRLLDVARAHGLPVLFTTVAFDRRADRAMPWLQKMPALLELQIGTRAVDIDPRLERRPDEPIIVKRGASAFFGTALASLLVSKKVDTVVLCGATTSGCIRATAVDLMQYGWNTLLPRDCVGDRARAPHDANLFDIHAKYADVVTSNVASVYLKTVVRERKPPAIGGDQ